MPIGTPQGPTQSQWTITATSIMAVADYPITFEITALADNPDAPGVADMVQQFVDLITASPAFQVNFAKRTYTYWERITPTA